MRSCIVSTFARKVIINIFVLDYDPVVCARYHNNRHTVKMILESTQLLNNAKIRNEPDYYPVYRKTHFNHPLSIWVAEEKQNFAWLLHLAIELCKEYTFRYNKRHKCQTIIEKWLPYDQYHTGLMEFAQCMPDQYRQDDPVEAYRAYYLGAKRHIAGWKNREIPYWWTDG